MVSQTEKWDEGTPYRHFYKTDGSPRPAVAKYPLRQKKSEE